MSYKLPLAKHDFLGLFRHSVKQLLPVQHFFCYSLIKRIEL